MSSGLFLFFLSPRVVDMDSYLPFAMALKDARPSADIRFVTFGRQNYDFIRRNETMVEGVERCGSLHFLGAEGGAATRLVRRAGAFLQVLRWILTAKRPVLFHGRQFSDGPYVLWYLAARVRGGRGAVLARVRLTDAGLHRMFTDRFTALPKGRKSLLARLLGRDADGLIHYHDRQDIYLQSLNRYGDAAALPRLMIGMTNAYPSWRAMIEQAAEAARADLGLIDRPNREVFGFIATKEFSATELRTPQSVEAPFRAVLAAIRRRRPDALILVRPHPLAVQEAWFTKAMEDFGGEAVRVTFLHPEVMARLTRRLIVNAPTNICYTTPDAAFIDVSDYKPEDLEARGGRSFADGHRVVRLDPTRADFEDALDAALADDARFDDPTIAEAASVLYAEPPTPVETVLEWIDAPTSRPPATLENSPTS